MRPLTKRHWNTIAGTLFKDEVYVPLLLFDEDGTAHGNDWARGFMRGMQMRHDGWGELVNDQKHGGCLIPMMMLCHEHDEDPEMRPEPISHGFDGRSIPASVGDGTSDYARGADAGDLALFHPNIDRGSQDGGRAGLRFAVR